MIPFFWDKTVTVYTKHTDGNTTKWYKYVVERCFYKANRADMFKDKELYASNVKMARIPQISPFLAYRHWAELPEEDKKRTFCIAPESVVCLGEVTTELADNASANELVKTVECFRVKTLKENSEINPKHFYVSGA